MKKLKQQMETRVANIQTEIETLERIGTDAKDKRFYRSKLTDAQGAKYDVLKGELQTMQWVLKCISEREGEYDVAAVGLLKQLQGENALLRSYIQRVAEHCGEMVKAAEEEYAHSRLLIKQHKRTVRATAVRIKDHRVLGSMVEGFTVNKKQ